VNLTSQDIKNITVGWHRCGYTIGAVPNPNPECGCMCGTIYDHDDQPVVSMYGRDSPACKCFPREQP